MRRILEIIGVEEKTSSEGKQYFKTLALLDSGEEAWGFGNGFKAGDRVECFYDEKWQQIKMRHGNGHEKKTERETKG